MKAKVQEMRAKVVEAEAEVPKAMATALREGKLELWITTYAEHNIRHSNEKLNIKY